MKRTLALLLSLMLCLALAACGQAPADAAPTTAPTSTPKPTAAPTATPEPTPEPVKQSGELDTTLIDLDLITIRAISYDFTEHDRLTVELESKNGFEEDFGFQAQIAGVNRFALWGEVAGTEVRPGETASLSLSLDLSEKELNLTDEERFQLNPHELEKPEQLKRMGIDHIFFMAIRVGLYDGDPDTANYLGYADVALEIPGYDPNEPCKVATERTLFEDDSGKIDLISFDPATGELWLLSENKLQREQTQHSFYPIINGIQFDNEFTNLSYGGTSPYTVWRIDMAWNMERLFIDELTSLSALIQTKSGMEPVPLETPILEGAAFEPDAYPEVYADKRVRIRYIGMNGTDTSSTALFMAENLTKDMVLRLCAPYTTDLQPDNYRAKAKELIVDGKVYNDIELGTSAYRFTQRTPILFTVRGGNRAENSYDMTERSDMSKAKTFTFVFELQQESYTRFVYKVFTRAQEVTVELPIA